MKSGKNTVNNLGFSLVEVIVSIVILALIAVPLLNYFVSSARYNARARNEQRAVALAQSIMEQCKDHSIEEIARSFHTVTDFDKNFSIVAPDKLDNDESRVGEVNAAGALVGAKGASGSYEGNTFKNSANGMLYYSMRGIQENGNSYDALITVDTNITAGTTYYDLNVNQTLSEIRTIESPRNVVAVETTQKAHAVIPMSDLNREYCNNRNASSPGTWLYPESEEDIRNALVRNMYIDIDPVSGSSTSVEVKIYYKYYCPGIPGCPADVAGAIEIDPPLYQETVSLNDLQNIYLFFQRDRNVEQVMLDIDRDVAAYFLRKINLYLLCQAELSSDTVPAYDININPVDNSRDQLEKVYSNANKVSVLGAGNDIKEAGGYIRRSPVIRMMNIRVDIYREGRLLDPDALFATLTSTKGR